MQNSSGKLAELKNNDKGFSLIELIIVIAIIVALTSVATGSFVALSHARSNKAANSLESLIAQSKVNALSGQDNVLIVRYSDEDGAYMAELHNRHYNSLTRTLTIDDGYYDNMELGNSLLKIEYQDINGERITLEKDQILQLRFNTKNGRLEYCWIKEIKDGKKPTEENTDNANTPADCKIYISFGSSNCVQIWKLTGEHHVVGQDS